MIRILQFDSSIPWLLRLQTRARVRRIMHGFSTPRRLLLSTLGLLLAIVYLGQAALSMWFREPMAPGRLQTIIPLALTGYVLWDFVQAAWQRPKYGIRFRPDERQQLGMAPLHRHDLIQYRLLSIMAASVLKAAFFTLVMIADLKLWPINFLGALLALALVDQSRLVVGTIISGMSAKSYRWFRAAAITIAVSIALSGLTIAFCSPHPLPGQSFAASLNLAIRGFHSLAVLGDTWIGQVAQLPFIPCMRVITASELSGVVGLYLIAAFAINIALAQSLLLLDTSVQRTLRWRERQIFRGHEEVADAPQSSVDPVANLIELPGRGPWSAIAWRQLQSARKYWANLFLALTAPGALSLMPLMFADTPDETFFAIVGSLAFYTFLLLPAALKFDFRRDVDRIVAIKLLPLPPMQVVVAQLLAPWLVTCLFQIAVLFLGTTFSGARSYQAFSAITILFPLSLLCFGLDNLIFLMYPHRLREEGLVMFVRTTLTFTAKGLFFAVGLGVVAAWAFAARWLAEVGQLSTLGVFLTGLVAMLITANLAVLRCMVSALRHFDVCWDRP